MKTLAEVASRLVEFFMTFWVDLGISEPVCSRIHNVPGEQIILGDDWVCIEYSERVLHLTSLKLSNKGEDLLNIFISKEILSSKNLFGNKVWVIAYEGNTLRCRLELLD